MWSSLQVEEWLNSFGVGLEDANQIIQLEKNHFFLLLYLKGKNNAQTETEIKSIKWNAIPHLCIFNERI